MYPSGGRSAWKSDRSPCCWALPSSCPALEDCGRVICGRNERVDTKLGKLRALFADKGIDGLIITGPENRYYMSGFSGSAATLVSADSGAHHRLQVWEQAGTGLISVYMHKTHDRHLARWSGRWSNPWSSRPDRFGISPRCSGRLNHATCQRVGNRPADQERT